MALRADNNFGLFSGGTSGGGGGGGGGTVTCVAACGGVGITQTGNPFITTSGTFIFNNTAPYNNEAVEVLGVGTCSTVRCCVNNTSFGSYSAALSGQANCSIGNYSVALGGQCNCAIGDYSFIGAGCRNEAQGLNSVIGGGFCNFIRNTTTNPTNSVIVGGVGNNTIGGTFNCNTFSVQPSVTPSGAYSFIGGGLQNRASGDYVSISGGTLNSALANHSTILGGNRNCTRGGCSTIGGGIDNTTIGGFSTIGGGRLHTSSGVYNIIAGGCRNITTCCSSTIGGGELNCACADFSVVTGGRQNCVLARNSSIVGGFYNNVGVACGTGVGCGIGGFVSGGLGNKIYDDLGNANAGSLNVVGTSTPYPYCCTNTTLQSIFFCGDVTTQFPSSCTLYYYHNTDKRLYAGRIDLSVYCSASGLTQICGTNLCIGTTNASGGYGRNQSNNVCSGSCFNVVGGYANTVSGYYNSTIVNGVSNLICSPYSIIASGLCNNISQGCYNVINNGLKNIVCGNYNLIGNGSCNCLTNNGQYRFIGNGLCNNINGTNGNFQVIVGGCGNVSSGLASFIGSGICNNLCGDITNQVASVIVGGVGNNTSGGTWNEGTFSFSVAPTKQLGGKYSFIGGGFQNIACGNYSAIVGGCCNYSNVCFGFIGGGSCNLTSCFDVVGGGQCNTTSTFCYSTIGGGFKNCINSNYGVIGGGQQNIICITSDSSFIGGGNQNTTSGTYGVIGGGWFNTITSSGLGNTILGGACNCVNTTSSYSSILGGKLNCINSNCSAILGGINNCTNGYDKVIISGSNIVANRTCSTFVNNLNIVDTPSVCSANFVLSRLSSGEVVNATYSAGVSSVGLVMPSAFCVTNSPITTFGNLCVSGAGLVSQYIRGDGTLASFPIVSGGGGGQVFYLNGNCGQGGLGSPTCCFYQMGLNASLGTQKTFTSSGDGVFVRFMTDANVPNQTQISAGQWVFNAYLCNSSTNKTRTIAANILKYCTNNGLITQIGTGQTEELTNDTTLDLYTFATSICQTTLSPNDRVGVEFIAGNLLASGNNITLFTEGNTLGSVTTTIPAGITSLNGLTCSSQNFITSTSGTDFSICSSGCTHCFNLPTASATNRGALQSSDWSSFNCKLSCSLPAYSFYVNPTASQANAITCPYRDSGELTLPGNCVVWRGTTPLTIPSGTCSIVYRWIQVGKNVTLNLSACYSVGGTNVTNVSISLPQTIPTPTNFSTWVGACSILGFGNGNISTATGINTSGNKAAITCNENGLGNCYAICVCQCATAANSTRATTTITYIAQ